MATHRCVLPVPVPPTRIRLRPEPIGPDGLDERRVQPLVELLDEEVARRKLGRGLGELRRNLLLDGAQAFDVARGPGARLG